jgi:redox-sensing transcriptional repressor
MHRAQTGTIPCAAPSVADLVSIPLPTLKRLPRYLELFAECATQGEGWLSSETIGRRLGLTAIQVRKDLALTGAPASPKRGFRVEETARLIADLIGANNLTDVFLIGAGPRGAAACEDESLGRRGFKIVAIFDPSPEFVDDTVCGLKVLPIAAMPGLVHRMRVHLALLAVCESRYPGCARLAAEAGIRGLVNLSGEPIEPIEELVVVQEDLGFQLASISREIDKRLRSGV